MFQRGQSTVPAGPASAHRPAAAAHTRASLQRTRSSRPPRSRRASSISTGASWPADLQQIVLYTIRIVLGYKACVPQRRTLKHLPLMQSDNAEMRNLVGSDLPPAPIEVSIGILFFRQNAISSAFVLTSSMQSMTILGRPSKSLAASSARNISVMASHSHHGTISFSLRLIASALDIPTSLIPHTAWRLRDDNVTWSKSISLTRPTPERTSIFAQ
jgi:hypothetical protein